MLTNQRLALLFDNAIGPEQEPMRAQPTLLKSELNMIRRSPATAGATPSLSSLFHYLGILLLLVDYSTKCGKMPSLVRQMTKSTH